MQAIPGIHLATGQFHQALPAHSPWRRDAALPGRHLAGANLGQWLSARVDSRYESPQTHATDEAGVTVLFEGYLTAVLEDGHPLEKPAATVLALFLDSGLPCLTRLRGSYSCLILDSRNNQAHLFNDRRASRPLFYRQSSDNAVLVGPEVFFLACADPPLAEIDPVAVCEFVLFASYYNERTLFPQIRKLPPASVLSLKPGSMELSRYWEIRIDADKPPLDEHECVEEAIALFDQSIRRLLTGRSRPALLLSGGIDSRVILGGLRRAGFRIPSVTYGTPDGDDAPIARQIAEHCGLPFTFHPIANDDPQNFFAASARRSDCRAETVDTPAHGEIIEQLAETYGSYLHGDKSFYGKAATTSLQALANVDVFTFADTARLADMLDPDVRRHAQASIDQTRRDFLAAGADIDPQDLKDKVYYEQRLANRQNAFAAASLRDLEPARPWLDEDLVDFLFAIPGHLRRDKDINRKMLEIVAPDLAAMPFAKRDSIPQANTYRKQIPANPVLADFIRTQFNEALDPRLGGLFRPGSLAALAESLASGGPFPMQGLHWWYRLPGMWRMTAKRYSADRIHPVSIMLRLMQINLYLNALKTAKLDH